MLLAILLSLISNSLHIYRITTTISSYKIFSYTTTKKMVRPKGFEPSTCGSGVRHSIQLSYGRTLSRYAKWNTGHHEPTTSQMMNSLRRLVLKYPIFIECSCGYTRIEHLTNNYCMVTRCYMINYFTF